LTVAALKDEISPALVRQLAQEMATAWPDADRWRLTTGLGTALAPLELMARVDYVAGRLAAVLPESFADAATILWRALESPAFTGWMTLPCSTFITQRAPGVPERVARAHRFQHVSVRRIRPGPHTIDVQVNGRVLGSVTIDVTDAPDELPSLDPTVCPRLEPGERLVAGSAASR